MGHPNWFAYFALLFFPAVSIGVFVLLRPVAAAILLLLVGMMFLPAIAVIDVPLVPAIGKEQVTYLAVLLGLLVKSPRSLSAARPGRGLESLVGVMFLGTVGTVLSNQDSFSVGDRFFPALELRGAITGGVRDLLQYGLPFFLGRALLRESRDLRDLLMWIATAGVLYTPLIFFELRFSPHLHFWTYGMHPRGFEMSVRYGGYRPHVYMEGGLALAIFLVTTLLATCAVARLRLRLLRIPASFLQFYLAGVLILSRSVAAAIYGLLFLPLFIFLRPRAIAAVSLVVGIFVCIYPALRLADAFPHQALVDVATAIEPVRGHSFDGRFISERFILARVRERMWFGWGGFNRAFVFDERGRQVSVVDGFWVNCLGGRGLAGLVPVLALHLIPLLVAWRRMPRIGGHDRMLVAGLMAIVAVRAFDLLPNGAWSIFPIFLAGGLMSLARSLSRSRNTAPRVRSVQSSPPAALRPPRKH